MTLFCSFELREELLSCLVNTFAIPLVLIFMALKICVKFLPTLFLLI